MVERFARHILLSVMAVMLVVFCISCWTCYKVLQTESHVRYVGIMNVAAEKIAKTISGMEMNAMNVFDEVGKHLDSPDAVIAALESKTRLNPEIRGYFAAFEPNYFPEMGQWFEPYVHHVDSGEVNSNNLFDSFGYTGGVSLRVLPVVTLESGIRGEKGQDGVWNLDL